MRFSWVRFELHGPVRPFVRACVRHRGWTSLVALVETSPGPRSLHKFKPAERMRGGPRLLSFSLFSTVLPPSRLILIPDRHGSPSLTSIQGLAVREGHSRLPGSLAKRQKTPGQAEASATPACPNKDGLPLGEARASGGRNGGGGAPRPRRRRACPGVRPIAVRPRSRRRATTTVYRLLPCCCWPRNHPPSHRQLLRRSGKTSTPCRPVVTTPSPPRRIPPAATPSILPPGVNAGRRNDDPSLEGRRDEVCGKKGPRLPSARRPRKSIPRRPVPSGPPSPGNVRRRVVPARASIRRVP